MSQSVASRMVAHGALLALVGFLASGPLAFLIVIYTKPQPVWSSAAVFVENYSVIQNLPYYLGFLLLAGMLTVACGHYMNRQFETQRFQLLLSLALTVVFCTLISFNYICQTTLVHNLVLYYSPGYDSIISTFSMSNPLSFCWANEMWGYAFLGLATWFMRDYYQRSNVIRKLLAANAIISLASPIWTIVDPFWVSTDLGLVAYFIWNFLMIALMTLMYREAKKVEV